ncbi:MAG TPA: hypothetical protein VFZ47_10765, partial [Chitinophagaceae bacterium]
MLLPRHTRVLIAIIASALLFTAFILRENWESSFVKSINGTLKYTADEKGNVIPDFSAVGYYKGDKPLPTIAVVTTLSPSANAQQSIQSAIDELAKKPLDANGFRGAILLKKGTYEIPVTLNIRASGIVLRGEGNETKLIATGQAKQEPLISVSGAGNIKEIPGTRVKITDKYVSVGAFSFNVASTAGLKSGDAIIIFRPGTEKWI